MLLNFPVKPCLTAHFIQIHPHNNNNYFILLVCNSLKMLSAFLMKCKRVSTVEIRPHYRSCLSVHLVRAANSKMA